MHFQICTICQGGSSGGSGGVERLGQVLVLQQQDSLHTEDILRVVLGMISFQQSCQNQGTEGDATESRLHSTDFRRAVSPRTEARKKEERDT